MDKMRRAVEADETASVVLDKSTSQGLCAMESTANGYTSLASSALHSLESDEERVGVFDYIIPQSQGLVSRTEAHGEAVVKRDWARDSTLSTDKEQLNGTELATFRCTEVDCGSDANSETYVQPQLVNGSGSLLETSYAADDDELEEIVVHSEVMPHRASYERYDPDSHAGYCWSTNSSDRTPVNITSIKKSTAKETDCGADGASERDATHNSPQYGGSDTDHSYSSSAVDRDSRSGMEHDSSTDSSLMSRSSIVYLNDWWRPSSLVVDSGGDDRYPAAPRSEVGRRLLRKRQKREQRRLDDPQTWRSEDVDEYKGRLSVEELLAFINDAQNSSSPKLAVTSTPTKERPNRRKKKLHSVGMESSDASEDTSNSLASEGLEMVNDNCVSDGIADQQSSSRTTQLPAATVAPLFVDSLRTESPVSVVEQAQFVVVQKKKKPKQFSRRQNLYENSRRFVESTPSSSRVYNTACQNQIIGFSGSDGHRDEATSLTSDTESSSSYAQERLKEASIRSYSPDFPDLVVDRTSQVRRNSTGNVCDVSSSSSDKFSCPPSTMVMSYAVVAASGLLSCPTNDRQQRRRSLGAVVNVCCDPDATHEADVVRTNDTCSEVTSAEECDTSTVTLMAEENSTTAANVFVSKAKDDVDMSSAELKSVEDRFTDTVVCDDVKKKKVPTATLR